MPTRFDKPTPAPGWTPSWPGLLGRGLTIGLALLLFTTSSHAATVLTLGGGRLTADGPDFGFADGNTMLFSQFHTPSGLAVDRAGVVYVADRDNGSIRRLDVANNRSTTLLTGLQQPVAVAVTGPNDIYFITQGDGRLMKMDRFGTTTLIATGLLSPTALSIDARTNLFVTETRGTVVRVNPSTGAISTVATGLNRPGGIAVLDSGLLAVSDTGSHRVRFINPDTGATTLEIGDGTAGFRDGPPRLARFHEPQHLAKTPAGSVVVADRLNHRVRLIDLQGVVTTLYGVSSSAWEGPECTACIPIILPGWFDGGDDVAEAREPVGVAVSVNGLIFTSEGYYHLIRQTTGADLTGGGSTGPGSGGSDTNLVVLPPIISPAYGYFPTGQSITVVNPNSTTFFLTGVYYTTDGTEPTTNSFRLAAPTGSGTILWHSAERDLTSLRLKAFVGTRFSETVSGQPASVSEIGVPRDTFAGMGSTLVLPVVLNLRASDPLKSLQFRVEITPSSPATPMIPEDFKALRISTNDFIRVVTADESDRTTGDVSFFTVSPYTLDRTRGLVITMIGTNSNFSVRDFAAVAMLSIPIPTNALVGDGYQIEVIKPSGTSDGLQGSVALTPMPPRAITVRRVSYEVGDTAAGFWYNADQPGLSFGDGVLDNADVNNIFNAALGLNLPFLASDLYDAMDTFPEDVEGSAGGDGLIRFLDWQVVLLRSLGLDPNRWVRTWTDGGVRTAHNQRQSSSPGLRSTPATTLTAKPPGAVWHRQALLTAGTMENVRPGQTVDVPVYVTVESGAALSGLAFRAVLQPSGHAPSLFAPMQFIPGPLLAAPHQSTGLSLNELLCGWAIVPSPAFRPALQGRVLLGHLRVSVPGTAAEGDAYTLSFVNADGAPSLSKQYDLETLPGSLWILSRARLTAAAISDEWKTRFFGSTPLDLAADADGDGISNLREYEAGTDPMDRRSCLHLEAPVRDAATAALKLRWLSAPGKRYTLESSPELLGGTWTQEAVDVPGDGFLQEWAVAEGRQGSRFYRLRLQP